LELVVGIEKTSAGAGAPASIVRVLYRKKSQCLTGSGIFSVFFSPVKRKLLTASLKKKDKYMPEKSSVQHH
jgi:hypothetical protein